MSTGKVLSERIESIIALLPDDFIAKESVTIKLRARQESIRCTAPEVMGKRWREVASILSTDLPTPKPGEWSQKVADLFGAEVA